MMLCWACDWLFHNLTCVVTGQWLLASHDPITFDQLWAALQSPALKESSGTVMYKFEPVVLHVQCRTLFLARDLLKTALDAGMRFGGESDIVFSVVWVCVSECE